jgi:hypothetical protein
MCVFNNVDYTAFINEQDRFNELLKICKNIKNNKVIIYTRFKYATLLFSKLFNFDINFSFIYSKFYNKYYKDDLLDFSTGKTKILLTDKITEEYININNLDTIICYDIDNECVRFFNNLSNINTNLSLLLLNDNNNTLLNNLLKDDSYNKNILTSSSQSVIQI